MEASVSKIYSEMLDTFHKASGYLPSPSCDLAARLMAAAAQISGLYREAKWVLDQSFPQTAQGIYLDRHAEIRGLSRGVSAYAGGILRFGIADSATQSVSIQKGTVCMTEDGVRFVTLKTAVPSPGTLYVDIPARAAVSGALGNVPPNTITILSAIPHGVRSCTNPAAFTGGVEQESDASLRERLLDTYRRLPNGANAAYYEHTALSYPGVAAATAVGRPRGVGSVDVYVADQKGLPSQALLDGINRYLQKKREISVDLRTLAPVPEDIPVAVSIQPAPGFTFAEAKAHVEEALRREFTGHLLGKPVTRAFLTNLLYQLRSVENCRLTSPEADIPAKKAVLPRLGQITVTEIGG